MICRVVCVLVVCVCMMVTMCLATVLHPHMAVVSRCEGMHVRLHI